MKHFLLSTQAKYKVLHGDGRCTKPESIIVFERLHNSMVSVGELSAEWTLANSSAQTYGSLNRTWPIAPLWKSFSRFPSIDHSIELLCQKIRCHFLMKLSVSVCLFVFKLFVPKPVTFPLLLKG